MKKSKILTWELMTYNGHNAFTGEYTNILTLVRRPRSWRLELHALGTDACSGRLRRHKETGLFSNAEEFFTVCEELISQVSWSDDDSWGVSDVVPVVLKYITTEDATLAAEIQRIFDDEYGSDDSSENFTSFVWPPSLWRGGPGKPTC